MSFLQDLLNIFNKKFFSKVHTLVLGVKSFFLQFLVDILPPGSADPDPKHCISEFYLTSRAGEGNNYISDKGMGIKGL